MKKKNVLSYGEFQQRMKNLNSPEDVAAFAKELFTPTLQGFASNPAVEEREEEEEEEFDVPFQSTRMVTDKPQSTSTAIVPRTKRGGFKISEANTKSPWYDVVTNDTESLVIDLYAKGMTQRDISLHLRRTQGIELSQSAISAITDKVMPLVDDWQRRPLSSCYPIVYLDGMHFKVRDSGKICSKVAYIALGISKYGQKEVLGFWVSETEGAKFWMHVVNDIKNRGVEDIFIACVDGLKGFPEAINALFPRTQVQVCVVHQIRHTVMFIATKDKEKFSNDLRTVYTSVDEKAGLRALQEVKEQWPQYAPYLESWEKRWTDLMPFFSYPEQIRKMIYSTNAIEALNRQFRKVTKTTQVFPHDESLMKLLWLAQTDIAEKWKMVIRNWGETVAQMTILFPDRLRF